MLRGVTKSYSEGGQRRLVLEGFNLDVMAGEVLVVRGPSGSGKTTLLNLLGGLDVPDSGQVIVDGCDLASASDDRRTLLRRHQIGFVFQFFNLFEALTVQENLCFPLDLLGMTGPSELQRVERLLREIGLWERRDSFPDTLSGGERQRIAVLRAIAHGPKLILADEPTGNLDPSSGDTVLNLLKTQVQELQAGLVLVTHSDRAAALGDRVLDLLGSADPVKSSLGSHHLA